VRDVATVWLFLEGSMGRLANAMATFSAADNQETQRLASLEARRVETWLSSVVNARLATGQGPGLVQGVGRELKEILSALGVKRAYVGISTTQAKSSDIAI
jgi:hypothetical protein